ncbi:hypothetical protein HanXRQr2_Chr04g0160871 [Helianthus annuus]|uniref:Uncharacterized protein n=1 Tax=Helianthus annuus TaxID=4232 RepID=A0A9K3NRC8_HELAN|nr:hypothetical protein HanXRQr2_Chr04g0160871 [Helianthus annuus]KAJ0588361.1 hypothetical protein HanIR_Chr04g0173781 [Helianthus annuus]KAJ0930898.1 hypothetical protein HanPSC8_Chr04g0154951 [Helianthus annuus]
MYARYTTLTSLRTRKTVSTNLKHKDNYKGSSPLSTIVTLLFGDPLCVPSASIL